MFLIAAARRIGQAVISAVGGAVIVFALLIATPGDPARRVLTARGVEDPNLAQVAAVRNELDLDSALPIRFGSWLSGMLRGDFGISWRTGQPVAAEFGERLAATAILASSALLIAIVLSLALGLLASARAGGWPDHAARGVSVGLLAVPGFLVGVLLLDLVAVQLRMGRVIADGTWDTVFLPAFVLALSTAAIWSRVLRSSLLEAKSASYLLVARARGASPARRMFLHQLPNALPPYLTVVGLGTAALLGGAPIIETIFSWPGIGRYTIEAITARDMPVVTAFTMIAVLTYVLASLAVDLITTAIDPRLATPKVRSPRRAKAAMR